MKQSVTVQNQKWLDKQMRLDRWRMMRLWYLQHCQQTFLRWLESNGVVQAHLTFMAEEADQLFIKEMGEIYEQSYHFGKHVEGAASSLRTFSQTYHAACSTAEQQERVQFIPLSELHPFPNHPFRVVNDERMQDTAESIREYGVLVPAIARPRAEGGYELVSGHRRHFAAGLAGLESMPVIVRNLDDDAATIIMVDSNLQRESILPSERAKAYKMKLDAIKRQGTRTDLTSAQVGQKLTARQIVASEAGESSGQIQRYIRLNELTQPLLDMVDDRRIAFNTAVELSYLPSDQQALVEDAMAYSQNMPSISQAQRFRRASQAGKLTEDYAREVMSEPKKEDLYIPSIPCAPDKPPVPAP